MPAAVDTFQGISEKFDMLVVLEEKSVFSYELQTMCGESGLNIVLVLLEKLCLV